MGENKYGSSNNLPNGASSAPEDETEGDARSRAFRALRDRAPRWISGGAGGLVGGVCTILFIIIPVLNTWLSNAKEVSLAQIKNSAEEIAYITKRMEDSDKERDLYKSEMLSCQQELRALKK